MACALLYGVGMSERSCSHLVKNKERRDQTVLVIGGSGGLTSRYRDVVEERGWSLRHYETRMPPGARRNAGKVALVVVMVGMVSHSLREKAQDIAKGEAPIVYLRSASASALRAAVEQWAA